MFGESIALFLDRINRHPRVDIYTSYYANRWKEIDPVYAVLHPVSNQGLLIIFDREENGRKAKFTGKVQC